MERWNQLPDELLLYIFRFLKEVDLTNASCTCRKWRRLFHDSSLWRSGFFEFSGYYRSQAPRLQQRLSGYVNAMGKHLHHLHIACSSPNLITAYNVAQGVRTLLVGISDLPGGRWTLKTFTLRHLNFDESWDSFRASKYVLASSLTQFFQAQSALSSIDLKNAFMTPPFSYRFLRCLSTSRSRMTVTSLNLVNFFCCDTPSRFVSNHLMTAFRRCWQLRELSMNYMYLHAIGVETLCEALADSLQLLRLTFYVLDQTHGGFIQTGEWFNARVICPRLKVNLTVHCWPREPQTLLVASLPLCELVVKGRQCSRTSVSLSTRLTRLLDCLSRSCFQTLESATFSALGVSKLCPPSQESLSRFLGRCTHLKKLIFSDSLMTPTFMAKTKEHLASTSLKGALL
ncbi:F-box only protein 39 [Elysia marginata]|uniref:F-box only protein 39 n=1 Tax=Elysia marginata TaxID=1093978 RepID=A0AAV4JVC8_9GAST|nr:F-box only protein 39 [Elysia marginata]